MTIIYLCNMTIEQWLNNDQLGIDIWNKKYRFKDESLEQWFDRVSGGDPEIRRMIVEKKFLFGGRTLTNRNTGLGDYNNCATIGRVGDSLSDIMKTASDIAFAFKASSGEGLSLSDIRPKGAKIRDYFESDGIIPFMEIFNTVTASISQGSHRRGALLMSLDAKHPQINDFIKIKSDLQKINNANLSVEVDDEFMEAVDLYYKTGERKTLHIKSNFKGYPDYDIVPIDIYKLMMEHAYKYAEPAVLYMNRFKNYNIMEHVTSYNIESCNPCSEQPLAPHSMCALCSFNLSEYVLNPFTDKAYFDFESFGKDMYSAVKAMDSMIDENMDNHPLKEQIEMATKFRNIGIGAMGTYDMLIKLGVAYSSDAGIDFIREFFHQMFRVAVFASSDLASKLGSFPGYEECVFDSEIIKNHFSMEEIKDLKSKGLRNCSLLSIAPTGTLATMIGCSYSTEILFAKSYDRKTVSLGGKEEIHKVYPNIIKDYIEHGGNIDDPILETAYTIDPYRRIEFQKAVQDSVDTACSVTFNLKEDVSQEYIEKLYLSGWKAGLKGISIFRDGSRPAILTTDKSNNNIKINTIPEILGKDDKERIEKWKKLVDSGIILTNSEVPSVKFNSISPVSRKDLGVTIGATHCKKCACGTLYITTNLDKDGNLVEIFTHTSKGGICQANLNSNTRLISLALRSGVKIDEIEDQLKGIHCPACQLAKAKGQKVDGMSCPDIISKTIRQFIDSGWSLCQEYKTDTPEAPTVNKTDKCPECGEPLVPQSGCWSCPSCGFSRCG